MKLRSRADSLPKVSKLIFKVFSTYSAKYLRRHFHTIRLLKSGLPPRDITNPLIIYLNHASWWDPLVCVYLSQKYFVDYISYAPIDRAALERYRFFKYLGFYGISKKSLTSALSFLRTTCAILSSERNIVWVTPQGYFADVRERPIRLQKGLGTIATKMRRVAFLPLAIEYSFWSEPQPEILVSFGDVIFSSAEPYRSAEEWTELLGKGLEAAQDKLASQSCKRGNDEWYVIAGGASGVHPIYDAWRWFSFHAKGHRFHREHQTEK